MGTNQATIQRAPHDRRYTVIQNQALQNQQLSWKARGLLAYLLSLPDDWRVYVTELADHSTDGTAATRSGLQELIDADYVKRERRRDDEGKFAGWTYLVYENPRPDSENPHVENPKTDNPKVENKQLPSTHEPNTHEQSTHEVKDPQPTAGVETPTTPQTMFSALAELCKWDKDLLTDKQRGGLNQTEKSLRTKGGATVQDVSAFGEWWYACDWRGKKGQPPLPHLVRENWKRYTDHRDQRTEQEAERLDALERQREQAQVRASEREQNPQLTAALVIWREATEFMRAAMTRQQYADWIAPLRVMEPVNGAFRLEAPNETVHEWVTARLMPSIERALNVAGGPAQIEVVKGEP